MRRDITNHFVLIQSKTRTHSESEEENEHVYTNEEEKVA